MLRAAAGADSVIMQVVRWLREAGLHVEQQQVEAAPEATADAACPVARAWRVVQLRFSGTLTLLPNAGSDCLRKYRHSDSADGGRLSIP